MTHSWKSGQTRRPAAQRGLGLVEIMVALAIGAVLLTGLIQVFIGSKLSYRVAEANARVQEGGRFAMQFMAADLRMAGYTGCFRDIAGSIDNILEPQFASAFSFDIGTPLQGYESTGGGWSPALPALIADEVLPGTDVVVTRAMSRDGIRLVSPFSDSSQMFVSPEGNNISIGDVVMVTDCTNASIGEITNVTSPGSGGSRVNLVHSASGMNSSPPHFAHSYRADAEVARLVTDVYYVSTQQLTGTGDRTEPALFRRSLSSGMAPQELVEGAEDLQILYGEDTDGDGVANRYATANAVGNMANVVSVRASLLMRTENGIASTPQSYAFNGITHTADDLRVRRVFTTTVKLRNRGIL